MQTITENETQLTKSDPFSQRMQQRSLTQTRPHARSLKLPIDLNKLETKASFHLYSPQGSISSFPTRERALSQKEIVEKISNFKDKNQIWEAVHFPSTTREKIKVIDAVIEKREQIEAKKKRKKSFRATALLPTLIPLFKDNGHQPTDVVNRFRKMTVDINFDEPLNEKNPTQETGAPELSQNGIIASFVKNDRLDSEASDSSDDSVKLVFPMEQPPQLKLKLFSSLPTSHLKSVNSTPRNVIRSKIKAPSVFFKENFENQDPLNEAVSSPKRRYGGLIPSGELQSKELTTPAVKNQGKPVQTIKNFESLANKVVSEQSQQFPTPLTTQRRRISKSIGNVSQLRQYKANPLDEAYQIAGRKFEKELFNFLSKNKNKLEGQAILNSGLIKTKKLRIIEEKVFNHFGQNTVREEQSGYNLNEVFQRRMAKSDKEKQKPNKVVSKIEQERFLGNSEAFKVLKQSKVGKKSSSIVRKVDAESLEVYKIKFAGNGRKPNSKNKVEESENEPFHEGILERRFGKNRTASMELLNIAPKTERRHEKSASQKEISSAEEIEYSNKIKTMIERRILDKTTRKAPLI